MSGDSDRWYIYGANIGHYQREFAVVLGGEKIVDFVKNRPSPVVVDIMGPSDTIASLFKKLPKDKPRFGLAVSLGDRRSRKKIERDERLNVEQLAGNIMEASTWRRINDVLQERKADLVMERAVGGLDCMPFDEEVYAMLINKTWKILSEQHGILLV